MTPEEAKNQLDTLRRMSAKELKEKLVTEHWGSSRLPSADRQMYDLAILALEEKEKAEELEKFNKTISATNNLVKATWALVIVTTILVFVTFLGNRN